MNLYQINLIIMLLIISIQSAGFAEAANITAAENNRLEQIFLSAYRAATDQENFLLDHLKSQDEIEINSLIWMIRNKSQTMIGEGKPLPPQFTQTLRNWKNHRNTDIAEQAEKSLQEVARYQFDAFKSEFRKGFISPEDEKAFLSRSVATQNELIKRFITEKLAQYDDPQAFQIIRKFTEEIKQLPNLKKIKEITKQVVDKGVEINEVPDKSKFSSQLNTLLTEDLSSIEKERLLRKYASSEKEPERTNTYNFMINKVAIYPHVFVPILAEYFGHNFQNEREIAAAYPELINQGLHRCLSSWNGMRVSGCIELITALNKGEYIQEVFDVTFGEQGYLNYQHPEYTKSARGKALALFSAIGEVSLPQLTQIIYKDDQYDDNKQEALKTIAAFKTKDSIALLVRFYNSTSTYLNKKLPSSRTVREELNELIATLEK